MEELKKMRVFKIFLIVFGLSLVIFIGVWLYDLYSSSRSTSTELSTSTLRCTSLTFDIDTTTIIYTDGALSFVVENSFGDKFDVLIVKSDNGEEMEFNLQNFYQGNSEAVRIENISITDHFEVHPKGCLENTKEYKI